MVRYLKHVIDAFGNVNTFSELFDKLNKISFRRYYPFFTATPWFIKGVRKKGKISFDDPTSRIKNLRKEKQRELAGIGIKTVGHFLKTARAYRRV